MLQAGQKCARPCCVAAGASCRRWRAGGPRRSAATLCQPRKIRFKRGIASHRRRRTRNARARSEARGVPLALQQKSTESRAADGPQPCNPAPRHRQTWQLCPGAALAPPELWLRRSRSAAAAWPPRPRRRPKRWQRRLIPRSRALLHKSRVPFCVCRGSRAVLQTRFPAVGASPQKKQRWKERERERER